jgi:hypothetical protein
MKKGHRNNGKYQDKQSKMQEKKDTGKKKKDIGKWCNFHKSLGITLLITTQRSHWWPK